MVSTSTRLTSRIPLYMLALLLFLQIFSPAPAVMFVLLVLGGVVGLSYLWVRLSARGITLHRQRRYGWAQVGDVIEERFILHNDAWVPLLWAEIGDHSNLPGYDVNRALGLNARDTARWTTSGTCTRRGVYTLGPTQITTGDPFGLFELVYRHDYSESFVVYPPIASLPTMVEPRGRDRGAARANRRSLTTTTNASSVREYIPGDALNRIHWRTTAKRALPGHDRMFVKEFDLEPSGDLWIILDMDQAVHAGAGDESTEEYAVILAASLANQMLKENHAVGLICCGDVTHNGGQPTVITPQKGHNQLWELLRALSGVHAVSEATLGELLEQAEPLMGQGMSAVVITPSVDPAWIEGLTGILRHGIHCGAVLLDALTFETDEQRAARIEREQALLEVDPEALVTPTEGNLIDGVVGLMADLGVVARAIQQGFEFQHLQRRRQQRPTYKTLGTGRVIVVDAGEDSPWMALGSRDGEEATS